MSFPGNVPFALREAQHHEALVSGRWLRCEVLAWGPRRLLVRVPALGIVIRRCPWQVRAA